jgi:hypothetical protein
VILSSFKKVIGFLIGTNLFIGMVAAILALPGFILFDVTQYFLPFLFVFFATVASYNFQRYFKWRNKSVHSFIQHYVPTRAIIWYYLIGIPALGCILLAAIIPAMPWFELSVTGLLTLLYLFIHPTTKQLTGLRFIPFAKTFIVAVCWVFLFFVLTHYSWNKSISTMAYHYWLLVLLEVWISCVLFDIRDVETDQQEVVTFVGKFGRKGVFILWSFSIISISVYTCVYATHDLGLLLLITASVCLLQLYAFKPKPDRLWFTFIVDGSLVGWALFNYCLFDQILNTASKHL